MRVGWDSAIFAFAIPTPTLGFSQGHVEAGETIEMAARRETEEETGIRVYDLYRVFTERSTSSTLRGDGAGTSPEGGRALLIFKTVHFFLAESLETVPVRLSEEHLDGVWLPFERAIERATFDNAKSLLRLAQAVLSK